MKAYKPRWSQPTERLCGGTLAELCHRLKAADASLKSRGQEDSAQPDHTQVERLKSGLLLFFFEDVPYYQFLLGTLEPDQTTSEHL